MTAPFGKKGGEGVAADRKFVQMAFGDDLLKDGKNSTGLRLEDKKVVWLRIRNHEKAALKPLAPDQFIAARDALRTAVEANFK